MDDASTDDSLSVLQKVAQQDPRVRVFAQKHNQSAWMARKVGVAAAKGKYLLFDDADDTVVECMCEELYAEMERNPVDILHFGTTIINECGCSPDRIATNERLVCHLDAR